MTQEIETNQGKDSERSREIRIALVLYGGVSLAVYENGVARSFFDLVKGNGIFELLLNLLDADAVVDVASGTSAGGINGLFLAAALESGTDFKQTTKLWRMLGDIGVLMRPISKSDPAESLLQGETYYQQELIRAFKDLLKENPGYESPGEMDVFITGTDLNGQTKTYWDALGNEIVDKYHRIVFQLKHRPGRRNLGLDAGDPKSGNVDRQATILASIARITSTFPAAFPPFRLCQIPEDYRNDVCAALKRTGSVKNINALIDGGVLDNKPFGPALNAIFYRMPSKLVDRRLFYVEPDPETITPTFGSNEDSPPNPLGVIAAALTSIPSHQSITEDLELLKEHNARIKWLRDLKRSTLQDSIQQDQIENNNPISQNVYQDVRCESLAKSLLLEVDNAPSAKYEISEPCRRDLYVLIKQRLHERYPSSEEFAKINFYDIDFQLRQAFYIMYQIYDDLEDENKEDSKNLVSVRAIGRIIKLLKLIRDSLLLFRDKIIPSCIESKETSPDNILKLFAGFLDVGFLPWQALNAALEQWHQDGADIQSLADRERGPISSEILSQAIAHAWDEVDRLNKPALAQLLEMKLENTILEKIEKALRKVIAFCRGGNKLLERFEMIDRTFFPLEFASGIHELDDIEVVRISPSDAKLGLSNLEAAKKVTGDDLAHFAAFFRRDWRSNDILWGRLDGICQIIQSLLNENALKRLKARRLSLQSLVTIEYLKKLLPLCPEKYLINLNRKWKEFLGTLKDGSAENQQQAYFQLKENMILASQQNSAH
jgi:patatin-related protein